MPRRISRLGGTTLRRSFMTNAYSPAIYTWGPRNGPQTPRRSDRPGEAVAPLYFRLTAGAPRWPPNPHRSGRPGEAVAPSSFRLTAGGPRLAPQPPNVRAAPAEPWRPSLFQAAYFRLRPRPISSG